MAALVHPRKLALFALLSLSDLVLTLLLLRHGGGAVYESNPLAGWWLASFGWAGLAAFKAGTVLVVAALAVVVSRSRPRAGGAVLGFGCLTLALVVGYSCCLAQGVPARVETSVPEDLPSLVAAGARLREEIDRGWEYRTRLAQLAADLGGGRCHLAEAAARLANTPRAHDPAWLRRLRTGYGARSDAEGLALNLIVEALAQHREDPAAAARLARRLQTEFRAAFGHGAPGAREWLAHVGIERKGHPHPGPDRRPTAARAA